mmetsp:Transcript_17995/g.35543  ORF Transcript_17995/g.35543 Transcript_17995/m.35543 type:complete len:145 (+) Transcript_17995:42-476(+)
MDNAALSRFKEQIAAGQLDNAAETLVKLKISMISLQSLPPTLVESSSAAQERAYACDVLENAVLMSVALQDKDGFQRHISQLKPLYVVVQGGNKVNTVGLNLMFLLVENRLAGQSHRNFNRKSTPLHPPTNLNTWRLYRISFGA